MSMTYESTDADGNTVTMPLFPEISASSQSYTFQSPKGLLFATQFAQIALVLVELSAFRDMKQRGLIVPMPPLLVTRSESMLRLPPSPAFSRSNRSVTLSSTVVCRCRTACSVTLSPARPTTP